MYIPTEKVNSLSNFWKNDDDDSIINELNVIKPVVNNSQKLKQKEFEKKFQEFFSFKDTEIPISHHVSKNISNEIQGPNSKFNYPLQMNKHTADLQKKKENNKKDEIKQTFSQNEQEKENNRFEAIS